MKCGYLASVTVFPCFQPSNSMGASFLTLFGVASSGLEGQYTKFIKPLDFYGFIYGQNIYRVNGYGSGQQKMSG